MCIVNLAYYAKLRNPNGGHCYNKSYGTGGILSAITLNVQAYNGTMWGKVMLGDSLKTKDVLERNLNDDEVEHLRLSIEAVTGLNNTAVPLKYSYSGNKIPLHFNKASNKPPSERTERIEKAGSHTFYGFKSGRECQ